MLNDKIDVISNNVKEIQSFEKRIKTFEYHLLWVHFSTGDILHHIWWKNKFKTFFSHGESNSCGVAIGFIGNTSFEVSNKKQDEYGRILILDVNVTDNDFLLINLHNATKESEQLNTPCYLLDNITDLHCKNIISRGYFNIFFNLTYKGRGENPKWKTNV